MGVINSCQCEHSPVCILEAKASALYNLMYGFNEDDFEWQSQGCRPMMPDGKYLSEEKFENIHNNYWATIRNTCFHFKPL